MNGFACYSWFVICGELRQRMAVMEEMRAFQLRVLVSTVRMHAPSSSKNTDAE